MSEFSRYLHDLHDSASGRRVRNWRIAAAVLCVLGFLAGLVVGISV